MPRCKKIELDLKDKMKARIIDIKDILIQTTQTKTEYDYIRGRLSGKKVQSVLKSADQNDGRYDFIWVDNKLTKRKDRYGK